MNRDAKSRYIDVYLISDAFESLTAVWLDFSHLSRHITVYPHAALIADIFYEGFIHG